MIKNKIVPFVGNLRHEINRVQYSSKIYICILIYIFICFFSAIVDSGGLQNAYQGMQYLTMISNLNKLLVITAAYPFAASFCEDWSKRYMNMIVLRSTPNGYIMGKICSCIFSSFFVSFVGLLAYSLFNGIHMGTGVNSRSIYVGNPLYDFSLGGMTFRYVLAQIFLFSMVSAVYAVMGMTLSAAIPNKFVAISAPLFMNSVMERVGEVLPKALDLFSIQYGNSAYGMNAMVVLGLSTMVCIAYIILSGGIFYSYVGRRIRNELS